MTESPIPDRVLELIDRVITSIDQLETLLLVRTHPDRTWSAFEVSDELRSNPEAAAGRLSELADAGLLLVETGAARLYRYDPSRQELEATVAQLAHCYREFRHRVIERVYKKPDNLHSFSEAFRVRKDRR